MVVVLLFDVCDSGEGLEEGGVLGDTDADGFCWVLGLDSGEGTIEDLAALEDHEDEIAERFGGCHVVGTEDDGGSGVAEFEDGLAYGIGIDGVETAEGFIEDEEFGLVEGGGDELDLLAHAFAECFDFFIGVGEEVESFEPEVDGWVGLGETAEFREELEVFADFHAAVEAAFLGEVTDAVAAGGGGGGAEQLDTAAIRQEDVEHHPERGGFSGAVGADEAVDGALGDFQAELVDGELLSEAFGDLSDFGGEHGDRWNTV